MPLPRGRKRGRLQRQTAAARSIRQRPLVISLDGASSSDEARSPSPCPTEVTSKTQMQLTLSPNVFGRGIMSDSDSDCLEVESMRASPKTKEVNCADDDELFCSDSVVDLYDVDYKSYRMQVMKTAAKEISALKKSNILDSNEQPDECEDPSQFHNEQDDDVCLVEEVKEENTILEAPVSPTLLDLKVPKKSKIKKNRNTKKALNCLKALSKEYEKEKLIEDSINLSITTLLGEDDDNPEITLRVKWGSDYLRMPLKVLQKFSHLYQELAERFSVSVSQIVLSYKDKVISSELCPKDLGITIADIIEGGIQSKASDNTQMLENNGPDSVCLKIQNADRKGAISIFINRYDKMIVMMHRYADEKNINIDKLKFLFDGEILNPSDTPQSLDLDGGECIDVYEN
ncbi:NFATC2-interacting protein [Procambarus clarkii]|uniref:NFATC2-interacting protein n=1 Tax=Procambarus clarkii TaxID=6728 RepID=UPI00374499B5